MYSSREQPAGVADADVSRRNILGHDCSRSDHCFFANGDAGKHYCASTKPSSVFNANGANVFGIDLQARNTPIRIERVTGMIVYSAGTCYKHVVSNGNGLGDGEAATVSDEASVTDPKFGVGKDASSGDYRPSGQAHIISDIDFYMAVDEG
jgi:hypothetical protein